jgi:hypothetical protein
LDGKDHDWILDNLVAIQDGVALMAASVRERQSLLK